MLSYATSRFRNGQTVQTRPSRFLSDIDRKYLHLKTSDDLDTSSTRTKWGSPRGFSWRPKKEIPREPAPSLSAQKEPVFRPVPANAAIPAVNGTKHDVKELKTGMRIAHSSFGKGTIELIDDNAGSPLIHVNFDGDGIRRLMLKFAKFEIL